jgi:hypothetical protein
MTRADKVLCGTAVTKPVPWSRVLCRPESMKEAGSGHEDSSDNMLTLDALQVSSSFR